MLFVKSEYLRGTFTPTSEKGQTLTMKLPGDDSNVMRLFIHWLYTGLIGIDLEMDGAIAKYLQLYTVGER